MKCFQSEHPPRKGPALGGGSSDLGLAPDEPESGPRHAVCKGFDCATILCWGESSSRDIWFSGLILRRLSSWFVSLSLGTLTRPTFVIRALDSSPFLVWGI